ncbi:MAG: ribonuclease III [Bacilli bacterium]|nr:ribonuclease III [Bacilli bacterium]
MNYNDFPKQFKIVCKNLSIGFNDISLYYEAFTHPSYANENKHIKGIKDYERIEFLGDALLDFLVGEYLYKTRKDDEGNMTKLRAKYVCEDANSYYTQELGLDKLIMVGVGANKTGEGKKKSVLGNIFEAFVGAMYLDRGLEYVRNFFAIHIFPKIDDNPDGFFVDYKSRLQETVQAERVDVPKYILTKEYGLAHDKTFEMIVKVGEVILGRGSGKSKEKAEQEAAKDALSKLATI